MATDTAQSVLPLEMTLIRQMRMHDSMKRYRFDRFGSHSHSLGNPSALSENASILRDLSAVNFLVGPNNSGKSMLLRAICSQPGAVLYDRPEIRAIEKWQDDLISHVITSKTNVKERPWDTVYNIALRTLFSSEREKSRFDAIAEQLREFHYYSPTEGPGKWIHPLLGHINSWRVASNAKTDAPQRSQRFGRIFRMYIPPLRTLRKLQWPRIQVKERYGNGDEKLVPPLRHTFIASYFNVESRPQWDFAKFEDKDTPELFTGEDFFELLTDQLLGTMAERDRIRDYQTFLSRTFFSGQSVEIIPSRSEQTLKIRIGAEKEQLVHNLGDGLQQLIILTLPFFLRPHDKPFHFFIEEPELYLHPGQQRSLLDSWIELCGDTCQVFATTHSNHFLDRTTDTHRISVFRVDKLLPDGLEKEKLPEFKIAKWDHEDLALLAELGVKSSSVLLTNATIWVEGITDRLYLRRFIDLMQSHLPPSEQIREDTHYSFVEYGGATITHWSFLDGLPGPDVHKINVDRLCSKLFLVADQWSKQGKFEARRDLLKQKLGDRFHELRCREIENIISGPVLRQTVEQWTGLSLAQRSLLEEEYAAKHLGTYLAGRLNGEPKRKLFDPGQNKPIAAEAKVDFCIAACAFMQTPADLSDEAKEIAQKLIAFVRGQNTFVRSSEE